MNTLHLKSESARPLQFAVRRIIQMSRVVADLRRAEQFYRESLGFGVIGKAPLDNAVLAAFGFTEGGAEQVIMRLGDQQIALIQFAIAGRPYPLESLSSDCSFQHAAIVVSDMDRAYAHLCQHAGWRAISEGGPHVLPPSDGGVRAFKFRDVDGHPLELIWFPPGAGRAVWRETASDSPFLGLDHSALSIASTARSLRFYRALGFQIIEQSLNRGGAQEALDALPGAKVQVTSLRPLSTGGPGLELLAYRPPGRPAGRTALNDAIVDWVTLAVSVLPNQSPHALQDPDGHRFIVLDQRGGGVAA